MKIALGSIFQNSTKYLDRYIAQYYSLVCAAPEHEFDPLLVEGDSQDNTWEKLNRIFPGKVTKRDHGGQIFAQVDNVLRWMQISYACEGVMERLEPEHDALLWVEADLIWEPRLLLALISRLKTHEMIFPMIMRKNRFYDTWAFAKDGAYFKNDPPFHSMFAHRNGDLYEVDSGGSCWAIRGDLARKCHFRPPARAMRGFCEEVKKAGSSMWLDPAIQVMHP